ncbi:glucan endo-1,3-beta-glucosidase-like [Apium graveolens]|uniref:glucan endo-1,3-beta-glucosidase-like n=1 Tax=Apium graveolens TaxID=4045 RepID=UPI003D7BDB9F
MAAQQASGQQHAELNRAGVCYGTFADNLPSPQEVVSLIQNLQANRIRLYGPDFNVLQALKNTSIEVVLGVSNYQLQSIASGQDKANQWIQNNVQNFPDINFSYAFNKPEIPLELKKDSQTSGDIRLRYTYFRSPSVFVKDGQLGYKNTFDAMVDAVYSALEKADASSLDVVVSETGWPTAGGPQATTYNARLYNNNLISEVRARGLQIDQRSL